MGAVERVVLSAFEGLGDMDGVVRVQSAVLSYARRTRGTVGSLVFVTDGRGAVKGDGVARGRCTLWSCAPPFTRCDGR